MIYITEKAAEMVHLSAEAADSVGMPLRITVVSGGEQVAYRMGFDPRRPEDLLWTCNGVDVLVSAADEAALTDIILDFQELPGSGPQFTFVSATSDTQRGPGAGKVD